MLVASLTTNEDSNGVIGIHKLKKKDKTMAKREKTSNTTLHYSRLSQCLMKFC
jgi:hypothetical protein